MIEEMINMNYHASSLQLGPCLFIMARVWGPGDGERGKGLQRVKEKNMHDKSYIS